jgi:hypothetical protein
VLSDDPGSAQVEAIRRHVNNRVVETAGAANFTTSYGDQTYLLLHSNRRTDAILLDALIGDQPDSDLIPKLVNGLLAHRRPAAGATPRRTSCPAGAGPLLQHLRSADARLRGPHLAGRHLRRARHLPKAAPPNARSTSP